MTTSIGYLGPSGSFSEAVSFHLYAKEKHPGWSYLAFPNLNKLIQTATEGKISMAVIPVYNSKSGFLKDALGNELISYINNPENKLKVINEKLWPLKFCLLGIDKHTDHIETVHTNEYAAEICKAYFAKHPNWKIEKHSSSSEAAKFVKALNCDKHAALASMEAAKEYGLECLDNKLFENETDWPVMRFLVVSKISA